jgi:rfaE bifunctional protein kinase chain/domain
MKKVLVVGDTILDHYVHGTVGRINPEASHSVVLDYQRESLKLGGATNVAANIKSLLGPESMVHYFGAVSEQVSDLLTSFGVASSEVTHPDSQILLKTRYICNNHYLLRVDRGTKYEFGESFEENLKAKLAEYDYDLIVISDYDKGTLSPNIVEKLFNTGKKILFDLKKRKNFVLSDKQRMNIILKCNKSEFESEIDNEILRSVNSVIQTVGENGSVVWKCNSQASRSATSVPVFIEKRVPVADVVGAGDAFLAGMAHCHLTQNTWVDISLAHAGNAWATEKVKNFGTHVLVSDNT